MHEGALIGGLLARLLRVPLVFDYQGSLTGEMFDHGFIRRGSLASRAWVALERFVCRLPAATLTSSVQAGQLLRDEFGVAPKRIEALPDCADLEHFAPGVALPEAHAALRERFGIPPERRVVAYLGLLADYQGTDHLLQAAAILKAAGDDVHFLIMGYPKVDHYSAMASEMGVADRVTLTGRVDYYQDAPRYLSLGDVAVSPKFSATEGSGKVLNYMALGQPVVAYDTPVHREYLADAGVYVPPGDVSALASAIRELLADAGQRQQRGEALRQRAASYYSWDVAGNRIDALYRRLLQQQSSVRK
jgi:glycosyltransferase involved in cell wall biosynthesis